MSTCLEVMLGMAIGSGGVLSTSSCQSYPSRYIAIAPGYGGKGSLYFGNGHKILFSRRSSPIGIEFGMRHQGKETSINCAQPPTSLKGL